MREPQHAYYANVNQDIETIYTKAGQKRGVHGPPGPIIAMPVQLAIPWPDSASLISVNSLASIAKRLTVYANPVSIAR